ncbi:putative pseudouridylate synthase 4 [Rhodotorula diobovata]|uniref:tRNA pseudouridine(55) synthase n=1 Tax=Rhodotorula diobovata TaxID=5288 RepID=A0A5C5FPT8_9BASI|nr:putative pseudouridylate synthase 4 [Rhodotorula diobovata]
MPKAAKVPLSALFAINKPTGIPSMQLLNKLQPLFSASELFRDPNKPSHGGKGGRGGRGGKRSRGRGDQVKMGQGGTLDPLADGVLVVGTNAATKSLSRFLDCTKEYRAIGLVGCSTDSYDSEGKRVRTCSWEGVTRESVEEALASFRGEIEQTPPIYSALKMDGKPLYEYARTNTPLPRPIPPRKVTVHSLELLRFVEGSDHDYEWPKEELDDAAKKELERLEKMVKEGRTEVPSEEEVASAPSAVGPAAPSAPAARPPFFEIRMTVSSGTYVRSIVHDLGIALGSAAHVVKLTRTRQGEFVLDPAAAHAAVGEGGGGGGGAGESSKAVEAAEGVLLDTFTGGCVEWSLLEAAIKAQEAAKKEGREVEGRDADGWLEWERDLLSKCKEV